MFASDKSPFDLWLSKVDEQIEAISGVGMYDLPDCNYCDWFEDGVSPKQAAKRAVKNAN